MPKKNVVKSKKRRNVMEAELLNDYKDKDGSGGASCGMSGGTAG